MSQFHIIQQHLSPLFSVIVTLGYRNLHQSISTHHLLILVYADSFPRIDFVIDLIIRIIQPMKVLLPKVKVSK